MKKRGEKYQELTGFKRFFCWIGWHSHPNFDNVRHGVNDPLQFLVYAKCRWCEYEGQIDSQGNLF